MSSLNPISFLIFMSIHGFNLFHMNSETAKNLSGVYAMVNTKESPMASTCPDAFDMELKMMASGDLFVFKSKMEFQGLNSVASREVPIDGQQRNLKNGQKVLAAVTSANQIQVQTTNRKNPNEKVVETFLFEDNGTMVYSTDHITGKTPNLVYSPLCQNTRYKKSNLRDKT